jgi:hypothetical protein
LAGRIAWLLDLDTADVERLRLVHWFLARETEQGIAAAPPLLDRLSLTSTEEEGLARSPAPGKVSWPMTYKSRAAGHAGMFWVINTASTADRPENQCLAFMINRCSDLAGRVDWQAAVRFPTGWRLRIEQSRRRLAELAAHPALQRITTPERLSVQHVQAARASRQPGFGAVAQWAQLYRDLFVVPGPGVANLLATLATFLLIPAIEDKFFELVVLSRADATLRSRGFRRARARLVGGRQEGTVIEYEGPTRPRLYYQSVPTELSVQSVYAWVLDAHGIPWRQRTPDVFIVIPTLEGAPPRYVLVEAKFSERDATIRDGLYQSFAYHTDFRLPMAAPAQTVLVSLAQTQHVPTTAVPVSLVHLDRFASVLEAMLARAGA